MIMNIYEFSASIASIKNRIEASVIPSREKSGVTPLGVWGTILSESGKTIIKKVN